MVCLSGGITMWMTDARRRRLSLLFAVYDSDGSLSLEREDFALRARVRARQAGVALDSARAWEINAFYLSFWDGIAARCDLTDSGRVTQEEWLATWEEIGRTITCYDDLPDWVVALADAIWRSLSDDGAGMEAARLDALGEHLEEGPFQDLRRGFGTRARMGRPVFDAWWVRYLTDDSLS
jgi:hypothetical protein